MPGVGKRTEQAVPSASELASGLAAAPQPVQMFHRDTGEIDAFERHYLQRLVEHRLSSDALISTIVSRAGIEPSSGRLGLFDRREGRGTSYSPPVKWKVIAGPTQVKPSTWDADGWKCIVLPWFLILFFGESLTKANHPSDRYHYPECQVSARLPIIPYPDF
jgi:hypothetical protein